jgi:hypothetical protein
MTGAPGKRELAAWAALGLAAVAAASVAFEQPGPLFVNLGAGDGAFARGFRAGWERDGLTASGDTMFHWTEDGSRLEFPVDVRGGDLKARFRVARFAETPAEMTLWAGSKLVDRWRQKPRGWEVRSVELGAYRGLLAFQFRSESKDGLGVALDWVEVTGARSLLPRPPVLRSLGLLLFGVPLVLAWLVGPRGAAAFALGLCAASALAVWLDRLGGLMAVAQAALPALVGAALFALLARGLRRAWPDAGLTRAACAVPVAALLLATIALAHPFFYYPDVDTHARFTTAVRADPYLAWDPTEYQLKTGAWTRTLGATQVRFPYSPFFHALAIPLVGVVGDVAAVKTVAALALALTLLLVQVLARALGLSAGEALSAQLALALFPVSGSRLTLALYPTLLGQATSLLLVVHLARRFAHLTGARDAAAAFAFLLLAQAAYTGSLFGVAAFVLLFAALELVSGDRRAALRLLGAYAVAALIVAALQYGRFVPVLVHDVLPRLRAAPGQEAGTPGGAWREAMGRLRLFYDSLPLALSALGLLALRKAPRPGRRLMLALLGAGLGLLGLRYAAPALFRDAKEIELLAPPIAVLTAAGLGALARRGLLGRLCAIAAGVALLRWGALAAQAAYAARFLAVGR